MSGVRAAPCGDARTCSDDLEVAHAGTLADLLSARALTDTRWLLGAAPAVLLFIVWELGKAIARSRHAHVEQNRGQPAAHSIGGTKPAPA